MLVAEVHERLGPVGDFADGYSTIASVLQTAVKNGKNPPCVLMAIAYLAYE